MRCNFCGMENTGSSKYCERCGRQMPIKKHVARPANGNPVRRPVPGGPRPRPQQNRQGAPVNTANPRPNSGNAQGRRPIPAKGGSGKTVKKERWNPKFLAACGGILVLLILIPILISVAVHNSSSIESNRIQMMYSGKEGQTNVLISGKPYDDAITGRVTSFLHSESGKVQAILSDSGNLYCATETGLKSIASGVLDYVISANGEKLIYIMSTEEETTEVTTEEPTTKKSTKTQKGKTTEEETTEYQPLGGEQYLEYMQTALFEYNVLDGSSSLIANDVQTNSISLSPSGNAICFSSMKAEAEDFEGFVYLDGVMTSLGRNTVPVGSSDDGKYNYYLKYENRDEGWIIKLFSKIGEAEIKLGEFSDANNFIAYLSKDFKQIIFSLSGPSGNFFAGIDSDKMKISSGFSPIYPYGENEVKNGLSTIAPVESFAKTAFSNASGMLMYLDNKLNCKESDAIGTFFRITPDGKTAYCMDNNENLYSVNIKKMEKKEIATHVLNFDLSADGSILYYVNSDNELHCVKGKKDSVAAENVYTTGNGMTVTDGGYLYFLENYAYGSGTLCYMKGDGKVHVMDDINNVHDLAADVDDNIYYRSDYGTISGNYDLYYGKAKKYKLLYEDIG